jgi:hypothetical protein
MWEVGLPPSPVEFSSHHHFYKLSHSWLLGVCRCSCLLRLACCEGFSSPALALRVPHSLCYVSFLLLFIQFFLFPWVGVGLSRVYADLAQGCLWEYHVPLSSPCGLCLPKLSGSWHLVAWEPSWFLCLMWSGDAMRGLRVWRSQSFASSRCFFFL